ncbi:hypothetical protein [Amycolatopsis sp.]|jgi:hypothetical protein|uniref:hypothetical protein n=1 Tax=Amycolatopsis sp. TaxID=37632 RepID=UPI002DF9274E|nr:hypothetical protein [Amycolatopsis sp.]
MRRQAATSCGAISGVKMPVTIHHGRLGAREYRVLRPAVPIRGVALRDSVDWYAGLCTESSELVRVAALWHLAARSRHTVVHIPLRLDPQALADSEKRFPGQPLDLLLVHHSLQFPASRWKQLRARLDRGRSHLADTGIDMRAELEDYSGHSKHGYDGNEVLDLQVHANTLVIAGSELTLFAGAYPFLDVGLCALRVSGHDSGPEFYSNTLHPLDWLLRHESGKGIYLLHELVP